MSYYGLTGALPLDSLIILGNNPAVKIVTGQATAPDPTASSGTFTIPFTLTVTGDTDSYVFANISFHRTDGGQMTG